MAKPGFEEIEGILDPLVPIPAEVEPELNEILPRGYLSVSQITTLLKCPYQWYLKYVEDKPQRTSARPFQGIQVHRAVEHALRHKLRTGEPLPMQDAFDVFATAFEEQKPLIQDWEDQDPGLVKDTGIECVKHYCREAEPKATPVAVEKTFNILLTTPDGKAKLPVLGRIDNIQVQAHTEKEYQDIREKVAAELPPVGQEDKDSEKLPNVKKPLRVHDLKVVTDKWSEADLENDIQFAMYAGVTHIPDVQVDQLVKGRAKVPRPRYEQLVGVMTNKQAQHALKVAEGVAKTIALGHFPLTDPGAWWCSQKWCSMWEHCRGKK